MIKHAREQYYLNANELLEKEIISNPKSYWSFVKKLLGKNNNNSNIPPLMNSQTGDIVVNDEDKANMLNQYFCSICNINDRSSLLPSFENRTPNRLDIDNITSEEISDVLRNLSSGKAVGNDTISHNMLKNTANSVCLPLQIIFNYSLRSKTFPDIWKSATVVPLFKNKGDKSFPSNYRPISLLSCVGKVFERVVYNYIHNFLMDNTLLYKYQSGFIQGHSTVHQLLEMYQNICGELNKHNVACSVFCDISKAFDRVWHQGLVVKLKGYGINGNLLGWLENYIQNRTQKVSINNYLSNEGKLSAGVPQGSVLGPLLFLIFINDIADNIHSLSRLFADDTSLTFSSSNIIDIELKINNDLLKLNEWANKWKVNFNPQKTECVVFTSNPNINNPRIKFNKELVNIVTDHKHLGITLSSNCKWNSHVENILKQAHKQLSMLRKLKFVLNRRNLEKIYFSYILPILEYACELWDGCGQVNADKIERVQREAARIVTGLPQFCSLESLYFEVGWESLYSRRRRRKVQMFFKIHNGMAPSYLGDNLQSFRHNTNAYNLRNEQDYRLPFAHLELYNKSFFPSTIKLWNDLDINIRNLPTISSFKRALKTTLGLSKPPLFFDSGNRALSVIHTRIRHMCSNLNADLHKIGFVISPACSCGFPIEDSIHYFFDCPLFFEQRHTLKHKLDFLDVLNIEILLFGDYSLPDEVNTTIFKAVQLFIKQTKRFTIP